MDIYKNAQPKVPRLPEQLSGRIKTARRWLKLAKKTLTDDQLIAATVAVNKSLACFDGNAETWAVLAKIQHRYNDTEAIASIAKAVSLEADNVELLHFAANLAVFYYQPKLAISYLQRVIELKPNLAKAYLDKALAHFVNNDYALGIQDFECRFAVHPHLLMGLGGELWFDENLDGKTLLLLCEQGLGDNIQFIRLACELKHRFNCRLVIPCPPSLARLFESVAQIDQVCLLTDPLPEYDYFCPLLSLLSRTPDPNVALGMEHSYFLPKNANKGVLAKQINVIRQCRSLRVGIVWHSSGALPGRDCSLVQLATLADINDVQLYSFQFGQRSQDITELGMEKIINDVTKNQPDFHDTALLMQQMHLILSVDTAAAHLAGALGLPCWTLLQKYADWRWGYGSNESVWYPTMLLFRQSQVGDWSGVVWDVKLAITEFLKTIRQGVSV